MLDCGFTYSHYEEILRLINNSDYKAVFFDTSRRRDMELIIRHDVDVDLSLAHKMAVLENRYGIGTTYFIMLRSPFYNIFDKANFAYIRGILALGHQIGLHFDESFCDSDDIDTIASDVDCEVRLLRDSFEAPVCAVSFHRPSQLILNSDIKLNDGLVNTYGRIFTKEFKYISDSRRAWKDGCLCGFLKAGINSPDRIQALVHPLWWTDSTLDAQTVIEGFLADKLRAFDSELEKNIGIYNKIF